MSDPVAQKFVNLTNSALALQGQGRFEDAIAHYEQALRLVPGHPVVLANLGNALGRVGRTEEALKRHRAAVAVDPHNSWFLTNLVMAERAAGASSTATLTLIMNEPLVEIDVRMWAALQLGLPEKAFAFRPPNLNVMPYEELASLYRNPTLRERIRKLPTLSGQMPRQNARPLIYSAADGLYAKKFAHTFVASALEKCPTCDVHLHFMNLGDYNPTLDLSGFPADRLTWTVEEMGPVQTMFYAHRRSIRFAQIQWDIERLVMLVDVDSIMNGNLLTALPAKFDVMLIDRPEETHFHQMTLGAFIAVMPSGRDFIDFAEAYVLHFEEWGLTKWYDDQNNCIVAREWFRRNVPSMVIAHAPAHLMDWSGTNDPGSLIWHAKGSLKR